MSPWPLHRISPALVPPLPSGGMGSQPRGGQGCVTSRPCPQLLGSVAIPQLLPWLFLRRFLVPAPTLLRARSFPRAAPLLPSSARRCAAGPALPHPRTEDPSSLGRVYVGEFCGLVACLHPARESKPSRGGRSINPENIYARANPRGDGMHPAAGAGRTPLCRGERLGLPCVPAPSRPCAITLQLPGSGQPSG